MKIDFLFNIIFNFIMNVCRICNISLVMQRSEGGGVFQAVDTLNGELLCGRDDVHQCAVSTFNNGD